MFKRSYGHLEFSFDNHTNFIKPEGQFFFNHSLKLKNKNTNFPKRTKFSAEVSSRHVKWNFDNPAGLFSTIGWKKFRSKCKKDKKIMILSKNSKFFNLVRWTRRMQFWQPCRTLFDIKPSFPCPTSEHDKKNTSFSKSYKMFPWTQGVQFWQHRRKDSNDLLKISAQNAKLIKWFIFFSKCFIMHAA